MDNNNLTTNQKVAAGVLLVFAFLVVFLWIIQFKNNLSNTSKVYTQYQDASSQDEYKDTDKDGLYDQDEINIYKTSPYLQDSDSDGFSDAQEVGSNNNPNCPAGKNCTDINKKDDVLADDFLKDMEEAEDMTNSIIEDTPKESNVNSLLSGESDVVALRKFLLDSGVDSKMLEQISDEDLLEAYQDVLSDK